jgi:chromosome segregation ATPase
MTFLKVTGIVVVTAALLVSGGLYFTTNHSIKQQQQAKSADVDATQNESPAQENWENFEAPLQKTEEAPAENNDATTATYNNDIAVLTDRINRLQQHMYVQMRTCSLNAQTLRNTVNRLEAQTDQLDSQKDRINDQLKDVNSSTPDGQNRRRALIAQRDRIDDQRQSVRRTIADVRKQFTRLQSDCRKAINDTKAQKRDAENQLQRAYSNSVAYYRK